MSIDILRITGDELVKNANVKVRVYKDAGFLFFCMALEMVNEIRRNNENGKITVFICPVGPVGQYGYFVEMVNSEKLSLKNVWFINMDEYMKDEHTLIEKSSPLSFAGYMDREVYGKISPDIVMPEKQRVFPAPGRENEIPALVRELGGVDVCFGGIGINGHIAFNEPPEENVQINDDEFKNLSVRVLRISRETRTVNAVSSLGGGYGYMPEYCITIGLKEILAAGKIRLYCFRDWHRTVVRQAVFVRPCAKIPVTFIQEHKDTRICITENVAVLP